MTYQIDTRMGGLTLRLSTDTQKIEHCAWSTKPSQLAANTEPPLVKEARQQINAYLTGKRQDFNLAYHLAGTAFQKRVWQFLTTIAYGETCSYQAIATAIQSPKAVRAVANAVAHNPLCLLIPCHRVIRSNGHLGGYAGGAACKRKLLIHEGAWQAQNIQ